MPNNWPPESNRLDVQMAAFDATTAKNVAKFWAHPNVKRSTREDAVNAVQRAIADTAHLKTLADRLDNRTTTALWLLRWHGGELPVAVLGAELSALGLIENSVPVLEYYSRSNNSLPKAISPLRAAGWLLRTQRGAHYDYYGGWGSELPSDSWVAADERLLQHVKPPQGFQPFSLSAAPPPPHPRSQRPQEVVLRLVELTELLRKMPKLEFNKSGRPSATLLKRLVKVAPWMATPQLQSSLSDPDEFWIRILMGLGILRSNAVTGLGTLAPAADEIQDWGVGRLGKSAAQAWISMLSWMEIAPRGYYYHTTELLTSANHSRGALFMALASLPEPGAWYGLTDLTEALWARIGYSCNLGVALGQTVSYSRGTPAEQAAEQARHLENYRKKWLDETARWVRAAIQGPLFYLGLIEWGEAEAGGSLVFRLTPMGARAADLSTLNPDDGAAVGGEAGGAAQAASAGPCWIVQPNLHVVAYIHQASTGQMAFLVRVAERQTAEGPVATFKLTRESVYRALESGLERDAILDQLAASAMQPMADSVRRTVEDWARRRERLTYHPSVSLAEYPTRSDRDAALTAGLAGRPLGERLVILDALPSARALADWRVVDYRKGPIKCLSATDEGLLRLHPGADDLLIRSELERWAEPDHDVNAGEAAVGTCWRLTAPSIRRAARQAGNVQKVIAAIKVRLLEPMPPWLEQTLLNWGDPATSSAGVGTALLVTLRSDAAAEALAKSRPLKPLIAGRIGPRTFAVKAGCEADLRAALQYAGFKVDGKIP